MRDNESRPSGRFSFRADLTPTYNSIARRLEVWRISACTIQTTCEGPPETSYRWGPGAEQLSEPVQTQTHRDRIRATTNEARESPMTLARFINENLDSILAEWEAFALTLQPEAETTTALALRNHAKEILQAMARDMENTQTEMQQSDKSKGGAPCSMAKKRRPPPMARFDTLWGLISANWRPNIAPCEPAFSSCGASTFRRKRLRCLRK